MTVFTAGDCTPFTYLIKCVPTNEYYYGVRYAKGCQPSDLWSTYFTSSNKIGQRIALFGVSAFQYEIRRTFDCPHKARLWEYNVLKRINAIQDPKWLNVSNGVPFTTRILGSQGKKLVYIYAEDKYRYLDQSTAKIIIEQNQGEIKGPPKPADHGSKVSNALKGKTKTKQHVVAIAQSLKNNPNNRGYILFTNGNNNIQVRQGDIVPDGYLPGSCIKGRHFPNKNKGKSYDEIYGCEKSQDIKEQRSQFFKTNNPGKKMKGKSYEELYGVEEAARLEFIRGEIGKQNTKEYLIFHHDSLVFQGLRLEAAEFLYSQYGGNQAHNLYRKQWLADLNLRIEIQYKRH